MLRSRAHRDRAPARLTAVQVGIDSYCYHRLLGEIRLGENDPGHRFPRGSLDVVAEGHRLGVGFVALETCFLPSPDRLMAQAYAVEAAGIELALSWGHPDGLEYGTRADALDDLLSWIAIAPEFGCRLVRLVMASPRVRRRTGALERGVRALATAGDAAKAAGVTLALENHADLTAAEMDWLLTEVGDPVLGACLDPVNALRVGDDPVAAARLLAPRTRLVHLKDVARGESDPVTGPLSVPFGEGDIPLDEILRVLSRAGYGGPVCVELGQLGEDVVDERELAAHAVGWLRSALPGR